VDSFFHWVAAGISTSQRHPRHLGPTIAATTCHPEGTMSSKRLTTQQRKEIFLSLVETQDRGNNVRKSYEDVTERFEISEDQLRQIEEEGLENEWPPLCEATPNSM
jgi:hypothetical protein